MLHENNLSVCGILESHVDVSKLQAICEKVFHRWEWNSNGHLCKKGSRIILGWDPDSIDMMVIASSDQVMHTQIVVKQDNKAFFCSFIYADNNYIRRRELWHNLGMHKLFVRGKPWVLLGDFNVALNIEDHYCGARLNTAMTDFKDCVEVLEVMDTNCTGIHYTWT